MAVLNIKKPKAARIVARDEDVIRGVDLDLSMVETVGAIHSLSASRITWHSHEQHELLLLLRGATTYEFADGRNVELVGQQFLIVPPGTVHRGKQDMRMPSMLCGIVFDPRHSPTKNSPFTRRELTWMAHQFESQSLAVQPMSPDLRRLIQALGQQIRGYAKSVRTPDVIASLRLLVCAVILAATRQFTAAASAKSTSAVTAAIQHMEAHFHEPLQMNEIARHAGCSRARLFEIFKRDTGMTPNDWLQRHRLNKARELLVDPDRNVTGIAYSVGFSSSQYFSTVFRKYIGTTPSVYRWKEVHR